MIKKVKKGFTIVELVIVIAVIGVLAAVLIPTFISLNKKADQKADNALVHNLNTALRIEETQEGKNPNLHEAVIDLEDYGYKLASLVAKSEQKLLWDELKDEFVLDNGSYVGPRYWEIRSSMPGSGNTHSIYAGNGWTETNIGGTAGINYGFDVGAYSNITAIHYKNNGAAQTVTIRTNGGTLTIDAENDTVNHYGDGEVLDIKAIAGASYHEYGSFPKASIAQGRIVVEEEGNIPAFEITAVPTSAKPIEIETAKSVVVSASQAVVQQLGDDSLENVDVKVTDAKAEVVVDEKIDTANVEAAGKTADDLVSITKVANYTQLATALSARKEYIMFTADIKYATNGSGLLNVTYSVTIDGDGHTLSGYGARGSQKTTLCVNNGGLQMVDVTLCNLTITNGGAGGRPVETRGNVRSLTINNCDLRCTASSGYMQVVTIGGLQSSIAKVTIKGSKLYSPKYYGIITFNPVDLLVENSEFECWAALYMKSPSSSAGSRGSKVSIVESNLICVNNNSGESNDFGAFVFEDGSIDVVVKSTSIDVTENGDAAQAAVVFSSGWAAYYHTILREVNVTFIDVNIKGTINDEEIEYDSTNVVMIQSGATTNDPTAYLADGSTVEAEGLIYIIK